MIPYNTSRLNMAIVIFQNLVTIALVSIIFYLVWSHNQLTPITKIYSIELNSQHEFGTLVEERLIFFKEYRESIPIDINFIKFDTHELNGYIEISGSIFNENLRQYEQFVHDFPPSEFYNIVGLWYKYIKQAKKTIIEHENNRSTIYIHNQDGSVYFIKFESELKTIASITNYLQFTTFINSNGPIHGVFTYFSNESQLITYLNK